MNFQTVKQANGQNIDMFATVVELNGEGINPTSQKPWKKITLVDANSEKHTVTIRGQNIPTAAVLQQKHSFTLSAWTSQDGQRSGFSGFWNPMATMNQNVQQSTPQMPQNAPQSTNNTSGQSPDKDACICRQKAGWCASMALAATNMQDDTPLNILVKILDIAGPLSEWFTTGQPPTFGVSEPQTFEQKYDLPPDE